MNAIEQCECINKTDDNSHPTGGTVEGTGLQIAWQDGPLGRGDERKEPNGAFVETVISAVIQRLEFYQESEFKCETNQNAISHLNNALSHLEARTADREEREVEGLHKV